MSPLQTGLLLLGVMLLAALVVHAAWLARKDASRRSLSGEASSEPGRGLRQPQESARDPSGDPLQDRVDPGFTGPLDATADDALLRDMLGSPERRPMLDVLIDVMVPLTLEHPVKGEAAVAALPTAWRAGSKPFAIEGLPEAGIHWETPIAGRRYVAFQAGVQLANRTGPLNEIEYSEFVMKTRAFADAVGAEPEFPEMLDEVGRARELDQFASAHDAQLGFMLRARQVAWSPGYLTQAAAQLGFVAGAMPGRLVLPARQQGAAPLVTLSFDPQAAMADDPTQSAVHELTLSLDVPHIERSEQPFVQLRDSALALAKAIDGRITDDLGHPLGRDEMDVIGAELESLYDSLASRELSAGSMLARRLFS